MLLALSNKPFLNRNVVLLVMLAVYTIIAALVLETYFKWQSVNFLLGAIAIPLVSTIKKDEYSLRYSLPTIVFASLALFLPVYTLFYFTLVFGTLLLIESLYGKTDAVLLILLFFLCPFFQYSMNVFSFPIRLELTSWAGGMMSLIGIENAVQGNVIDHNNNSFTIDAACMGLNMLVMSLVVGISILAWNCRKAGRRASLAGILLFLLCVVGLNIAANLFRIITMVLFVILPGTLMHELVGILFLLLYVILPSWFLSRSFARKFASKKSAQVRKVPRSKMIAVNSMVFLMVLCSSFVINEHDKEASDTSPGTVHGFHTEILPGDVIKLQNASLLVYLKKINAFYSADHTPYICWQGSGYEFNKIAHDTTAGFRYFTGELVKGKERLFTAWWYESSTHRTIDQFDWRWGMLRSGSDYYVVNVSASSKQSLKESITGILSNNTFKTIIK